MHPVTIHIILLIRALHCDGTGSQPDWDGAALAAQVPGAAFMAYSAVMPGSKALYLGLNGHEHAVQCDLPAPPSGCNWRLLVDSAREAPDDAILEDKGAGVDSQVCLIIAVAVLAWCQSHALAQPC